MDERQRNGFVNDVIDATSLEHYNFTEKDGNLVVESSGGGFTHDQRSAIGNIASDWGLTIHWGVNEAIATDGSGGGDELSLGGSGGGSGWF